MRDSRHRRRSPCGDCGNRESHSAGAGPGDVSKAAGAQRDGPDAVGLYIFPLRPAARGEVDGPEEFHVILLDGGRTKLLEDEEKRTSLTCIRCGACLNHCPVYRKIGGHSFPWVYSGPIGAIITPSSMASMRSLPCPLLQPVRRVRGSLPGEDRYSEDSFAAAGGREGRGKTDSDASARTFRISRVCLAATRPKLWRRLAKLAAKFSGPGFAMAPIFLWCATGSASGIFRPRR